MVTIHLVVGWLGSRLKTPYTRLFRYVNGVNEWGIHLRNRSRSKSGRSLLSQRYCHEPNLTCMGSTPTGSTRVT
uniref:Uncharacterized protein n=1 Tax=Anguilla anguilla TaxID=7936 RepID=A0A0E9VRK4_ANGAN